MNEDCMYKENFFFFLVVGGNFYIEQYVVEDYNLKYDIFYYLRVNEFVYIVIQFYICIYIKIV